MKRQHEAEQSERKGDDNGARKPSPRKAKKQATLTAFIKNRKIDASPVTDTALGEKEPKEEVIDRASGEGEKEADQKGKDKAMQIDVGPIIPSRLETKELEDGGLIHFCPSF